MAAHWVVMDDHIGIIAISTAALCMVGLIAHTIWSYKTGRIEPNEPEPGTKQVSLKWIVACVVIWLIVAIPLLNMLYPEFSQDRGVQAVFALAPPVVGVLFWLLNRYGKGDGYIGGE